jgi:hypothetical protein
MIYGLAAGVGMSILGLVIHLMGLGTTRSMQYVSLIPFAVAIVLNGINFSKENEGFVTFGNVFGNCFKASMIAGIILIIYSILSMFLFPEMKVNAIDIARKEMAKNPSMTDEQIETALTITRKYWNVIMVSTMIFSSLFYGAIFSLIAGAIAKKNGPRPISDNF